VELGAAAAAAAAVGMEFEEGGHPRNRGALAEEPKPFRLLKERNFKMGV
jgi:hypothetical protein